MPNRCRASPPVSISATPARILRRWCWRRNMSPECAGSTLWNERVWSKIGAKNALVTGLAQDGTPLCAGMHNTTPEDMLRFTLLYTPSWHVVSKEQIISDSLLKSIQTMGNPEAYKGSTEEQYGTDWFGEDPGLQLRPSGTMPSATAPCSNTETWGRESTSTRPAISVACTSVSHPTLTKSRASITRLAIFVPPRSYLPVKGAKK